MDYHEIARKTAREICDRRGPETLAEQVERAISLIEQALEQALDTLGSGGKDSNAVES